MRDDRKTELIHLLRKKQDASDEALHFLITNEEPDEALFAAADAVRQEMYGRAVYLRGLIEFTNHCRNNCYYCGIRRDNRALSRYRLTKEEILSCCNRGFALGYRTFVLQGGEDPYYDDGKLCDLVASIRARYPDCAVTLSVGEKERASYEAYYAAGARRYLLRHETADGAHYKKLHPPEMSLENRKRCLFDLKEIGYQVGAGFMVGSPYQRTEHLIADIRFMQELMPDMIGIGPFLSQSQTPFRDRPNGSLALTLRLLALLRLLFPYALIPATTALGTLDPLGRERGLKAGANVIMPNLSPTQVRASYALYDNKICTGEEAAECKACLAGRVETAGYQVEDSVGDVRPH